MWQGVVFVLFPFFQRWSVPKNHIPPTTKKHVRFFHIGYLVEVLGYCKHPIFSVLSISPLKFTIPNKRIVFATLQGSCYLPSCAVVYMVNLRIKGTQTMQDLDSVYSMTGNAWKNVPIIFSQIGGETMVI